MAYGCCIRITGERALFVMPEMKAERLSYGVITPSAARGIIEAIYWHPGIAYRIDRITVLNPIRYDSIRRNEVGAVAKLATIKAAGKSGGALYLDVIKERQQRASVILRDVDYLVDFHFDVVPEKMGELDDEKKFYNILLRRLRKGQHHAKPYLGTREFPADVTLVEAERPPSAYRDAEPSDFGYMLYDIKYADECQPMFFHAIMRRGVIEPEVS